MANVFDPRVPFDPAKVPFFYGWVVLGCCVLTILASCPGQTAGVGPFVDSLLAVTGLERTNLSIAYFVGTLASGLLLPTAGRWVDRLGTRRMLLLACLLLAVVVLALSGIDLAVNACASWLDIGTFWPAIILLSVGFACLRFSAQGLMVLCTQTAVGHWFDRRRGLATAISGGVLALAANSTPLLLDGFVQRWDWDGAWQVMALIVGPCFGLFAWIFWREEPEPCGLLPDGRPVVATDDPAEHQVKTGWTRAEAARTRAFWTVVGCSAILGLVITATAFHLVDIGKTVGLDRTTASSLLLVLGSTSLPVGILGGFLADRVRPRWLVTGVAGGITLHLATMPFYGPGIYYFIPGCTLGFAAGMTGAMSVATLPRFFGRLHLGAINGLQWSVVVIASAVAPVTYALVRDQTGSYTLACWLLLPIALVLLASALTLKPPVRAGAASA